MNKFRGTYEQPTYLTLGHHPCLSKQPCTSRRRSSCSRTDSCFPKSDRDKTLNAKPTDPFSHVCDHSKLLGLQHVTYGCVVGASEEMTEREGRQSSTNLEPQSLQAPYERGGDQIVLTYRINVFGGLGAGRNVCYGLVVLYRCMNT